MFCYPDLIAQDALELLGIDLASGIAEERTGRWFVTLIRSILSVPPVQRFDSNGQPVGVTHRSRLGRALFPTR